jgi:starvation-inducible DNA-binding protein
MKEQLADQLKVCLSDAFTFYFKAHNYHWNVEGPDFFQYHELFGKIYEEVLGSVDTLAEQIRTLDIYAPGSLSRIKQLTSIVEDENLPSPIEMARHLFIENNKVLASLMIGYKMAEEIGELGISNFLQDRIQAHQKHAWFLRSVGK